MNAQVRPDDLNHELHFYDFEDGYADDLIGVAYGQENDNVTIHDGILDLTSTDAPGGSITLDADEIQLNTYSEVTIETWATPLPSANAGNALMMWCFGTYSNPGQDYLFFVPLRWGSADGTGQAAGRLSVGADQPWANEDGFTKDFTGDTLLGDEMLHHYVLIINADNVMSLYVDGAFAVLDSMDETHILANISNDTAFIGKSVYEPDPTWKGTVDLFSIWDIALTADEVLWLFDQGPNRGIPVPNGIEETKQPFTSPNFYVSNNRMFVNNLRDKNNLSVIIYNIAGVMVHQNNDFRDGEYLDLSPGVYIVKSRHFDNDYIQKMIIR
jgi:hypothetical protein